MIEGWFCSMNKYGVKVNDDFDIKFLCEGLDIVFRMDHYILLTKVLAGLYTNADIFRGKARLELFGNFLMDKYFYHLFFYWEENTRNIFMQLILFRLLTAKRAQVRYEIKKRKKDKDFIDPSLSPTPSVSPTPGSTSSATATSLQQSDLSAANGNNTADIVNIILLKRYDAYMRKIDDMKAVMDANENLILNGWTEPVTMPSQQQPQSSKKSKRGAQSGGSSASNGSQSGGGGGPADSPSGIRRKRKEFVIENAPAVPVPNIVSGYTQKGGAEGETPAEEPQKSDSATGVTKDKVEANAGTEGGNNNGSEEEDQEKQDTSSESDGKKKKRDKKAEKAEKKQAKKDRKAAAQNSKSGLDDLGEKVPDIPQNLLKYMDIAYEDFRRQLEKYKAWESKSISEPPKIMSFN